MAVSVVNYQGEQSVPKLNSLEYDGENGSLTKFLPSHSQKPSRLPSFDATVTQQNYVGNFQRNASQGYVRNMGSHRHRHSMYCGDLSSNLQQQSPSQSRNGYKQSFSQSRSEKMRRRALSFNEHSGKNKYPQNFNTPLAINTLQKGDKQSISSQHGEKFSPKSKSSKSMQRSEQSPIQSQKLSQPINQEKPLQHIDQKIGESTKKVEQEKTVENNSSISDRNNNESFSLPTNQQLELTPPESNEPAYSKELTQSINECTNSDVNSNIDTTDITAPIHQNSTGQESSNQPFYHNTSTSSTDLRKSMYKEQNSSFTKRLRRVFSLTNIKQDGVTQPNNSSGSNSILAPSTPRFSSLRGTRGKNPTSNLNENAKNHNNKRTPENSNVDKDILLTKGDTEVARNNHKTGSTSSSKSRRRTFIDLQSLFTKNDKKQYKEHKHQNQQEQRHFRASSSDRCPSQKKRSDDKKQNSKDVSEGINPSEDNKNKDKHQNENQTGKKRASIEFSKKAFIPPRFSSLPSRNNVRYKHPSVQQLQVNCQPQICNQSSTVNQDSKDCVDKQPITQNPLNSSPTPISSETVTDTSEILNIPSHISTKPYLNMNTIASHSVPLLTTVIDADLLSAPSTPSYLKKLQFSSTILVHDTWTRDDYDRRGDQSTCNRLTPLLAQQIKQELNEFKLIEMQVHEDSKKNTHFFA